MQEKKLTVKGEISSSTIVLAHISIPLLITDTASRLNINKETDNVTTP